MKRRRTSRTARAKSSPSTRSRRPRPWASWRTSGPRGKNRTLRIGAARHRNAERGRGRGRRPRRAAGRRADHDLHRLQGLLLMIPNMYKIAGELTPHGLPRRGALAGDARALDLRRPQRRDGRARDRLRDARARHRAGGAGLGADRPRGDAASRAFRSSTSSTASAPRTRSEDRDRCRTTTSARMIDDDAGARAPRARAVARPPGAPRHGAEPRRVLPGPRGRQPFYARLPGHRAEGDGRASPSSPAATTACSTTSARRTPSA